MANARKDAGEAQRRPRPSVIPSDPAAGKTPAHAAGISPAFDRAAREVAPRAGPHKGMLTNPWVRYWTGQAPPPVAEGAAEPRAASERAARAPAERPAREAGAAPRHTERREYGRQSKDAGGAPEAARARS